MTTDRIERLIAAIELLSERVAALEVAMRTPRKPWRLHVLDQYYAQRTKNNDWLFK